MRRWIRVIVGAGAAAALVYCGWRGFQPSDEERLAEARTALKNRDFARAEMLARKVGERPHADGWAWMVAAEAAARDGRPEDALSYYEQIRDGDAELRGAAAYGRGEICLQLGLLGRAEQELTTALQADPDSSLAQRRLVDLFNLTGRRHRATPWLEQLLAHSVVTLEDLFHAGDPDHALSQTEPVRESVQTGTADPLLTLGVAFELLATNEPSQARELFERVLRSRPDDVDALAGLGEALLQSAPGGLPEWRERLPDRASADAAVASVLGQIAEQAGHHEQAARLYAGVVSQRPTSRIAWHRLGQCLSRTGHAADAEQALDRAQQLQQLALWLDDLFSHRNNVGLIRRVAEQLAVLGRAHESAGWAQHALGIDPDQLWAAELLAQLQRNPAGVVDATHEAALADLLRRQTAAADFADDERPIVEGAAAQAVLAAPDSTSRIGFVDAAPETGLDFVYHAARHAEHGGARIIETTGGGAGVLDCDADGWPDLYLTQGSREFPMTAAEFDADCLFRNVRGERWADVTANARLADEGFGQGVAAGDFDNDGFADLYVANYGVNRLFQNQGDGTFRDVTPAALREHPVWTSSCAIVDLNGDGAPDLFDVTYCRGADVETRLCNKDGITRSCSPRAFQSEPDRMWLNSGDGGWELADDCGLDLPDGYGLGLIVFRTDPAAPLGLFIANDEVPNYWLVNAGSATGGTPRWNDRARLSGLAVDANGQSQACMGVACDDVDGDGLPDLFVTNFYHESNTLYRALAPELYEDATRPAGLRDPGWNMLGFGTQFVDADLDSWPDLLVANGHIDDLTSLGEPFQMPLQCFRNLGRVFRELPAAEAGECFARPALGRGMARLDWNRDGREDAVVVNQESSAVLLTNESQSAGQAIVLQLRSTRGARDAIGAIVRVRAGDGMLTRQLTAGDGYQASNERQLVIGIADSRPVEVEVCWPEGTAQRFGPLATSAEYLLLQDGRSAVRLRSL
jgi:tetratricopeptide (TPR) repeat protein